MSPLPLAIGTNGRRKISPFTAPCSRWDACDLLWAIGRDSRNAEILSLHALQKYVIEELDGEKIVARRRGITVNACASCTRQRDETPQFQTLPPEERAAVSGEVCRADRGQDLEPLCISACKRACDASLNEYDSRENREAGCVGLPCLTSRARARA